MTGATDPSNADAIVIQARMGSTRLPGKVMLHLEPDITVLDAVITRVSRSRFELPVYVATTRNPHEAAIEEVACRHEVPCFRGATEDVLERFISIADVEGLTGIVRVCADNPFVESSLIDELVFSARRCDTTPDYVSHMTSDGTPAIRTEYGLFAEYVSVRALRDVRDRTDEKRHREHVTSYIYENEEHFETIWLTVPEELRSGAPFRLTVDTWQDFRRAQRLLDALSERGESPTLRNITKLMMSTGAAEDEMIDEFGRSERERGS